MNSELLVALERRVRNDMHSSGRSKAAAITRVINSVCGGMTNNEKAIRRRKLAAYMNRQSSPKSDFSVLARLMDSRRDLH